MAGSGDRLPIAALGFGIAAALASWNPLSAPFGVVGGLASLVLAVRALARGGARRRVAAAALGVSALAVVASSTVLALTVGVGRDLGGTPLVPTPGRGEASGELDRAAGRSQAARDRARGELERLEPAQEPTAPAAPLPGGKGSAR